MVRTLLVRGMLAGLIAGVLAFAFARIVGEPLVNVAIGFEDHMHQLAGDPPEPELVSRAVQSTIGLATGVLVYGCAFGGIFALVFAAVQGRLGALSPRATAALLAFAAFTLVILVPQLKYPANPPSIGDPDTIGRRTALYFGMLALSLIVAGAAFSTGRALRRPLGAWNAAILGGVAYVVVITIAMLVLPVVDEVPKDFPASVLWHFRLASLGIQAVLWTVMGLVFGALAERALAPASLRLRRA